jgi:hypothetical protein
MSGSNTIYKQSIDSRVPDSTNGPFSRTPLIEGLWTYRYYVSSTATTCNIQPTTHPEQTRKMNVMSCKPEWYVEQGRNYHAPSGTVTINLAEGLDDLLGPAKAAASSWAAALGRSVNVVVNEECKSGLCVNVTDDFVMEPGPEEGPCGEFVGGTYNVSTGEWMAPANIRLNADWTVAHPARNQRHIAHELGHYFGLWNRITSGCAYTNSVMAQSIPPLCYSSNAPPQDAALGPTATDVAALKDSTYGNQNRKICGW